MKKLKALFICVHNSARSQMAAALMNKICGQAFQAESAGLTPGTINPLVVEALQEIGLDISQNRPQSVEGVLKSGRAFDLVVTVCSQAEAEGCPVFHGASRRLHWPFDDPSKLSGTREERLGQTRHIRDQIQRKLESFCAEEAPGAIR
jgi:arsenate reductase (thioredoxin)